MNRTLIKIEVQQEQDVVLTRQRARLIAGVLDFGPPQRTAVATVVSELARNAVVYAGGGTVEFQLREAPRGLMLHITIRDRGPGIAEIKSVMSGVYQSTTGMGLGILGSQRLSDLFEINTSPQGTILDVAFRLPRGTAITPERINAVAEHLLQQPMRSPMVELQHQNAELLLTIEELNKRQAEVERLNSELAETNRGVLALYAELDEQAVNLRAASQYKNRFLSDMTHELRTPLNAMISLSRLLLDRTDGDLTVEQEKQVSLILRSASSLGEMVNDLLDIAKIESGKTDIHVEAFELADLFAALRGMFRPLFANSKAALVIEEPFDVGTFYSDEQKISQILRNLISNALKFTETGEVRVRAEPYLGGKMTFNVIDTGIGIAEEDLGLIFNDFTQISGARQRRVRGTGLGLPLTRKMCQLLGGDVSVTSVPGKGSTFTVLLPRRLPEPQAVAAEMATGGQNNE